MITASCEEDKGWVVCKSKNRTTNARFKTQYVSEVDDSETTCNDGVRFAECVILSGKALEGKQLTFSFQVVLFEFTGDRNILRKLLEYIK